MAGRGDGERMTAADLRPLAEAAWDRYGLSAEARAVAWDNCFIIRHGKPSSRISRQAARCYAMIAASLRPFHASRT